jgi:hypothetical protein
VQGNEKILLDATSAQSIMQVRVDCCDATQRYVMARYAHGGGEASRFVEPTVGDQFEPGSSD